MNLQNLFTQEKQFEKKKVKMLFFIFCKLYKNT